MLYLKRLNFFTSILQQTQTQQNTKAKSGQDAGEQMSRLYNDALVGLFSLGVIPEQTESGLAYMIDGDRFPVTAAAKKIMDKRQETKTAENTANNQAKEGETAEFSKREKKETEISRAASTSAGPMGSGDTGSPEPQAIVNRHIVKVSNKKNPSDVKEFIITVIPLGIKENATATDIAVEIEHNGQFVYFVSEQKRKSIMAEIDGVPFNIRGQWQDCRFKSALYLGSALKADYTLSDKQKEIFPDEVHPECYQNDFVRTIENSTLYILPFSRINEPNGQCKTIVVQETEGDRQIYCDKGNVLMMYLNGVNFRVYGKWTNKQFQATVEQMD